jgi:hypothetical protein
VATVSSIEAKEAASPLPRGAAEAFNQLREILPTNFDQDYIENAIIPFLRASV